ncbi:MAG TPA: serine hydrolase domain-containing protein [Solirubrobacterales bacterium]|nr:serine hydrolase domain-containing protein [Solirubrobacterales bacterium]
MRFVRLLVLPALACLALVFGTTAAAAKTTDAQVLKGLEGLVTSPGGPPGAIATLYRDGKLTTLSTGRADIDKRAKPRATEHMRIASVAKAFSGAVALHLVREGKLSLDDTIAKLLPSLPSAWGQVTVEELLHHTSGVPNYTESDGFVKQAETNPRGYVSPQKVISWVAKDPLAFKPDSKYEYSNTDNIVVGLMVEAVTGATYGDELQRIVFGPTHLTQTSLPTTVKIPSPFIHGYMPATETKSEQDVSEFLNPAGAWASGAIISTPQNLNAFIRADLGLKFFGRAEQQRQMNWWAGGESSPPGPGKNSAGLALFRYQTRCGTVYGHTGNFPGYVQFAAATADGSRAVTTTLNIPAPTGQLLKQLRHVQTEAVCDLLGK